MDYKSFYDKMSAVETAFNDANVTNWKALSKHTGTDPQSVCTRMGEYLHTVTGAIAFNSGVSPQLDDSINRAVVYLIQLFRDMASGVFSFGLASPEEMAEISAEDKSIFNELSYELDAYEVMSPMMFLGAACVRIPIDTMSPSDVADWCSQQAAHLAKYCICHGIDLCLVLVNL